MVKDSKKRGRKGSRGADTRSALRHGPRGHRPSSPGISSGNGSSLARTPHLAMHPSPALRPEPRRKDNVGFISLVAVASQPAALPRAHRTRQPLSPKARAARGHYPRLRPPRPKPLVFPTLHLLHSKKLGRLGPKPPRKAFQKHRTPGTGLTRWGDTSSAAGPFRSWLPQLA